MIIKPKAHMYKILIFHYIFCVLWSEFMEIPATVNSLTRYLYNSVMGFCSVHGFVLGMNKSHCTSDTKQLICSYLCHCGTVPGSFWRQVRMDLLNGKFVGNWITYLRWNLTRKSKLTFSFLQIYYRVFK